MKTELRRITVDGKQYRWSVKEKDWDTVLLTVWVDGQRQKPWFVVEQCFNNPWHVVGWINESNAHKLQLDPITPKQVSETIRLVLKQYDVPSMITHIRNFRVLDDKLILIES